jgi:chromosome segregation ATPase
MKLNYEDSRFKKERMGKELIEIKNINNEFKEENMFFKREMQIKEEKLKELRDDLKFSDEQLQTARKENEKLYKVIKGIKEGEMDSDDVLAKLQENIDSKINENRELMKALEMREKQVKEIQKKLEDQELANSGILNMSQYQTFNANAGQDPLEQNNLVPLSKAMAIGTTAQESMQKTIDQLRQHNTDLKTLLEAKTVELDKKESALRRSKEELNEIYKLNKDISSNNMELDNNLEGLKKLVDKRTKEVESLENQLELIRHRSRENSDKLNLMERDNLKLRGDITEKETMFITQESQINSLKQKVRDLGGIA